MLLVVRSDNKISNVEISPLRWPCLMPCIVTLVIEEEKNSLASRNTATPPCLPNWQSEQAIGSSRTLLRDGLLNARTRSLTLR